MADVLNEISRSLGRIEGRLDQQDNVLDELKESHKVLQDGLRRVEKISDDFTRHVGEDAKLKDMVTWIAEAPLRRRVAIKKWVVGAASTLVVGAVLGIIKGCTGGH